MSSVLHTGFTSTDDHHEGLNPPEIDLHLPVKEKERVRLEILLDKECIELKDLVVEYAEVLEQATAGMLEAKMDEHLAYTLAMLEE